MLDHVLEHPEIARLASVLAATPGAEIAVPDGPDVMQAAVALVLRAGGDGELEMLLIKRAEFDGDPWSGHVALPGGRREPADTSLERTAVRETWEETSIDIARDGRILGTLDDLSPRIPTLQPLIVRPFVVAVVPDVTIVESPEVAAAFWVPLAALRTETAWISAEVSAQGRRLTVPAFSHGDYVVWGLTERILRAFLHLATGE
jgi:8-oxo-dGTP pyrophosphatase MutT (NUDIX family)